LIADGELEVVMPVHFKLLLIYMRSIDQVIGFFKKRGKL
jgi:hypothetical protein